MKKAMIAALALVISVSAGSQIANAQEKVKIGEKIKIGKITIKKDTNSDGSTTIRPNSTSGPSITGKSIPRTRGNPSGGVQGSVGWTWEIK